MVIFTAILILILIPLLIINTVHVYRIHHILKHIAKSIEHQQGEQRSVLSSYADKVRKMGFYKTAIYDVEHPEVKELFKNLLADEERHIKVLEKIV